MADTTVTRSSPSIMERFRSFVTTRKGLILAAEIVLSLFVIIFYASSFFSTTSTVAICEMVFALVYFVAFVMDLDKQFAHIIWIWSDFLRALTGAAVYVIVSLVNLIKWSGDGAWMAGGIVGLIAGLLFCYDTYTIFLQIKSSRQQASASTGDTA